MHHRDQKTGWSWDSKGQYYYHTTFGSDGTSPIFHTHHGDRVKMFPGDVDTARSALADHLEEQGHPAGFVLNAHEGAEEYHQEPYTPKGHDFLQVQYERKKKV